MFAQFDIARVYEEEKHTFLHKWLALADPNDLSGSTRGFVKVCVSVLGAGDEAPVRATNGHAMRSKEDLR